jgi:hypothetical protein
VDAPRDDDRIDGAGDGADVRVVVAPDRVASVPEAPRLRGAQAEEVHDLDATVSPRLREADAPADGRIVARRVGGGWIEHAEGDERSCLVPSPP